MTSFLLKIKSLLGKKPCLEGKIEITGLSPVLKFCLLKQKELLKINKSNLKPSLKGKLMMKKKRKKFLREIKLLLKSKFYSLNDKFQINEILLGLAFLLLLIASDISSACQIRLLLILILILLLCILLASDISSACRMWQFLQWLLQFLFGSGPG